MKQLPRARDRLPVARVLRVLLYGAVWWMAGIFVAVSLTTDETQRLRPYQSVLGDVVLLLPLVGTLLAALTNAMSGRTWTSLWLGRLAFACAAVWLVAAAALLVSYQM